MEKSKLNFIINALMFLCLMAMAGLGFLMKYILPSGRDVILKYGRNLAFSWLGWDRHDWGDIHLYLAFTLLALLAVHLILHWQQILGLFRHLVPDSRRRYQIALVFLLVSLLLLYFPFLITPEMQSRGRGGGGGHRSQINGSQSLKVVALRPESRQQRPQLQLIKPQHTVWPAVGADPCVRPPDWYTQMFPQGI